jgi:tRNA (mo5U34)-methyltransferase
MDAAQLRDRIAKIDWYHEFDFGNGIRTQPRAAFRDLWSAAEVFLGRVDFAGKRVLDIGCWDGYWSFFAERHGAKSVLATDKNDQRWTRIDAKGLQVATPGANPGFQLAHDVFESKVVYNGDVSVYELDRLGQVFDTVLFLGVFYHLTHPSYAFTQVRHAVATGGVAVFEGGAIDDTVNSYAHYYYGPDGKEPYRVWDSSNWFIPTRRCLLDMIRSNYFEVEDEFFLPHPPSSAHPGVIFGRAMVRARAVRRVDLNHLYRPQMGLDRYDPRFTPVGGGNLAGPAKPLCM